MAFSFFRGLILLNIASRSPRGAVILFWGKKAHKVMAEPNKNALNNETP